MIGIRKNAFRYGMSITLTEMRMTMAIHAHVNVEASDCDGRISRSYVMTSGEDEDVWDFRAAVIGGALAFAEDGTTATFADDGYTTHTVTDEGYESTEVRWCEDDDEDARGTYRDHSAEAMGY